MRRTLYTKMFFGFLLFGLCGFLLVALLTSRLSLEKLKEDEIEQLHREASVIASDISKELSIDDEGSLKPEDELASSLEYLSHYLNAPIWIIQPDGSIVQAFSSENSAFSDSRIKDFRAADFGDSQFLLGDFYGCFKTSHLSVLSPIQQKDEICGYVLIHKPLTSFHTFHNEFLNISYLSWGILLLFAAILFLVFTVLVYRPIRTLSIGAKEYAKGNYSNPIPVKNTDNELGYIAASLNYMADKLNTIEEKQRNFISNVSHDFRSPLTSIRGYIDAILDGTIPPELQEKYLNIILFETERLTKLTESLLELNKYEGRTFALEKTDFDINGIIQKTADTFEGTCREKRLEFELLFDTEHLRVHADLSKIQQVLYNLIDNAIKFSHTDSKITIETTSKNGKAYISVKDYGIGIPRDSIGKIWERFYKTDLSRGRDRRGTGLGLSIVKEIVQAHEENINVISTEGVGTEFIFTLPLKKS